MVCLTPGCKSAALLSVMLVGWSSNISCEKWDLVKPTVKSTVSTQQHRSDRSGDLQLNVDTGRQVSKLSGRTELDSTLLASYLRSTRLLSSIQQSVATPKQGSV